MIDIVQILYIMSKLLNTRRTLNERKSRHGFKNEYVDNFRVVCNCSYYRGKSESDRIRFATGIENDSFAGKSRMLMSGLCGPRIYIYIPRDYNCLPVRRPGARVSQPTRAHAQSSCISCPSDQARMG